MRTIMDRQQMLFLATALLVTILQQSSGQSSNSHLMHYEQAISSSAFGEPIFRLEPPNVVNFANTRGAIIPCLVSGSPKPKITWYTTSVGDIGQQTLLSGGDISTQQQQQSRLVNNVTNLRQVTQNGAALILLPFKETDFRQEIHSIEYRCVASNNIATIHSRSSQVQAVISNAGSSPGNENVKVNDEFVLLNAPAVLKCKATSELEFSQLVEWFTNDGIQISAGETSKGNKFTAFKSGELHIANVDISDLQRSYGCKMRNTITNKISSSSGLAQLIATDTSASLLEASSHLSTGKLLKPSSSSLHETNHQLFANLHLTKQTTSQVLHSISQIVTSDQLSEQVHILASDSDKSFFHTQDWRLLLPCAVRTNSNSLGAADESGKSLFEMRWFFQASLSSSRRDDTQKPVVPLEQYAAASSISLQYLNFVGQSASNGSLHMMAAIKSSSRSQQLGISSGSGSGNNNNNNNKQDKSTKFVVGPTFLAIEWPTKAQSGRYVCQLVLRTQEQSNQEAMSRTVCDINVIIRQPMKLKVEAVTKLNSVGMIATTSNPTKAALSSGLTNQPTTSETTSAVSSGNLLIRAINWFSKHKPLSGKETDSMAPIQPTIRNRNKRTNSGPFLKQQTLAEEESRGSRIQVQGSGLIEPPPIVRVGERLQLDCLGSGHPIEIVKWFKNGQVINTQSSSDFQIEITSIGDNNILSAGNTLINDDIASLNQQITNSQVTTNTISSLVIRQLQPRDAGLAMFECFTYNSFGDKARAGLAIMIVERQLVDWARSVCLINNNVEESSTTNSSWSSSNGRLWEMADGSDGGRQQEQADLGISLPEYHNSMALEEQEFANNDWPSNSLIFKRNNPLKQALLLESEPVELSCPSQRFLRSNLLIQLPPATQNLSARLDWRRWRGPQQSSNGRKDVEQIRESRNFNQLFSGDSRFVINGSSLQIRSPSKRHDEAIYLCRLTVSRREQKTEDFRLSNPAAGISSALGFSAFELEALQQRQQQFAAEPANAESRSASSSSSSSDSLLDLNSVHRSSLAASSTSVSASCINSMQDIFVIPTAVASASAPVVTTTSNKQQQDVSDQVTLAMSSISIRIVAKPKIDPFEFSRSLEEGMRAVVVCAVISGHSPVEITWFKDGSLLVVDNSRDQQQQQELEQESLSIDQANSFSSTLTFHRIKASHSGFYTCVAANAFAATNHTSRLTVNVAPYFIDAPKNTQAVLNSNVVVNCRAGGQPNPQIRWRKLVPIGGILGSKALQAPSSSGKFDLFDLETSPQMAPQVMQQQQQQQQIGSNKYEFRVITSNSHIQILENGSMIIKDVESSDSSRYVCQASNGINPSLSEVIDLLVLSPAQFDVNYETISVKRDALIKFNCAPKGDRPMQIEWRKEGNLLAPAPGSVLAGGSQNQASNNKPIQQQQSKYSEIAFLYDSNGSTIISNDQLRQRHSNLILQPSSQQQQQQLQRESTSFIQDNNSKRSQESLRSSELFINYADRTDTGTFVCIARNAYGKDELTYRLVVQEVPDVPLNLDVQMVQANSLKLIWLAPFDGNLPLSHFIIEYRRVVAHITQSSSGGGNKELPPSSPLASTSILPTPMPLQLSLPDSSLRLSSEWIRLVLSINKLNSETVPPPPPPHPQPINAVGAEVPSSNSLNNSYLPQQQFSVTLRQLIAKSTYHIRVAAVNAIGQGAFTSHLSATTAEEPPSIRPNDVRTQPLSSSSIKVLWRGPAIMDEQAPIKGYYVSHRKLKQQANSLIESTSTSAPSAIQTTADQTIASGGSWIATQSISTTNSTYQALDGDGGVVNNRQYGTGLSGGLHTRITTTSNSAKNINSNNNNNQLPSIDQLGFNYEFVINHLDKNTKYEIRVQPYNAMGVGPGSEVIGQTLKFDRPGQPSLKLVGSRKQSFELKWAISDDQPLMGFSLFYKAEYDDWQEIQLGIIYHYVIDNLRCGNKYQIYLSAFNAVGRSDPSDVLNSRTEGTVPIAPDKSQFFKSNITEVVLDMNSWQSGGCTISSFMIQFKRLHESNWFILSEGATPFANSDKITIPDLTPATWYKLLVTALNEAGSTNAEYLFSTLNLNGEEIAPTYQLDHESVGHHQSSWLGGSSHVGKSVWSSLNQYLFPNTLSPSSSLPSHQNNESGQLLLPLGCILLLLVASITSYLYYSKVGNTNSPNSTSSNLSNFSGHSQTRKSCYQNGLRDQMQRACDSENTTLPRTSVSNHHHQHLDEKQLIQSNHNSHHHLIDAKSSFALDASDKIALSHEQHQTQTLGRSMLDSLIGSAAGLQSFVGTSSRASRSQHGMKLLSSANIFSNAPTKNNINSINSNSNNNHNNTPNSNCTSSSLSTHSTNCFEGSTVSSSGTSNTGAGSGSKAKLQLIDESSMISGAIGEENNLNYHEGNNNNSLSQYYYDTSTKQQQNSSPARAIYSALRANNHVDVVNQGCDQGSQNVTSDAFANPLFVQSQPETQSRAFGPFTNQRQLLSTSFASATDLLQRQQQQQQQIYYPSPHQQEEPVYQRLDKFQSYGLAAVCKQQQFVDQAARAQTLRFNTHFSLDDTAKSMTLHRQNFHQPQSQVVDQHQQQQQFTPHGFYDHSLALQNVSMFQPSEQRINYEQQQQQPGVSLVATNDGSNISEIEQHLLCNNNNNQQQQ